MKKMNLVQFICIGGLLTSLTVLLQSAPVFLPAIGLAFSPFSTLPIAIAAVCNIFLGVTVFLSSTFILIIVSPQEAMILLFTTGILGVVLGALLYRKGILVTILAAAIALTIGMSILTYIVAIPSFSELAASLSQLLTLLLFGIFSIVYVSIWFLCFKKFANRLIKIKLIEKSNNNIDKRD